MVTKTFPGNYKSLEAISMYIIQYAESIGFTPAEVYAIQTAVDEACANIIDHAYGGENLGEIHITLKEIQQGLRIIINDNGEPFDPDEVPHPDIISPLEIRKERGLGIFFMRQLMDKVIFKFSQTHGNTLTMMKYKGK
jgi:serine/threonine-protein kinase RsbW